MAIEETLERIAIAVETIAKFQGEILDKMSEAKPGKKAKEAEVDPLADAPAEFTQEQVKEALQVYMKKSGIEKTKELMIKYGADKAKPTLPTIPVAKYAEIMAALEKEK